MNLDQAEPRHDAQIAHLPEPPSLRTYRARQAPRLPAAPRTLAETGLDEAFVAALLLKSMLAHGRSSLTEIVARHGLPPAVLDEVLTFLACERLIEVTHRGLSDIDLTLRLTELGRALALEEKARNSYCGPAPVTHEAYVASVTAHSVRHVTIARADAHAAFDGIVVEPAMLDAAAASLNAGRPLLIYGPAGSGKTYLAERLGSLLRGNVPIPYAIYASGEVIKIHDPLVHVDAPRAAAREQRERERGRLAAAGFRLRDQVVAGERDRQARGLDRRHVGVAELREIRERRGRQRQRAERRGGGGVGHGVELGSVDGWQRSVSYIPLTNRPWRSLARRRRRMAAIRAHDAARGRDAVPAPPARQNGCGSASRTTYRFGPDAIFAAPGMYAWSKPVPVRAFIACCACW